MDKLNLPPFHFKINEFENGVHVYDIIRKKFVKLTPEEWVRQHLVHYLINELHYPKSLIKVETGLRYNRLLKRSDVLAYNRNGEPFLLAECKSSTTKLDDRTLGQVAAYNYSIGSEYLLATNGMIFLCCRPRDGDKIKWLPKIPEYPKA